MVRDRDRDRYLATLYAPTNVRPALFALHALDLELARIVVSTTEPLLGEIRLAWWREALTRLDAGTVAAQPVLAALAAHALPRGVSGASLEPLEDGFLALLLDATPDAAALTRYAARRGGTLFAALATVLGGDAAAARPLGEVWALGELARGATPVALDAVAARAVLPQAATPVPLRPLRALAALAGRDLAAAAAGQPSPPRGSAGRQARLLWAVLTGR